MPRRWQPVARSHAAACIGAGKRTRAVERSHEKTSETAKKPRPGGRGVRVTVKIEVLKDGEPVTEIDLSDMRPLQVCTFGRSAEASVPLEHPSLSRIHAQLEVGLRGELQLVDRGSGARLWLAFQLETPCIAKHFWCCSGHSRVWARV